MMTSKSDGGKKMHEVHSPRLEEIIVSQMKKLFFRWSLYFQELQLRIQGHPLSLIIMKDE